jgi:hypothetical protein
MTTNLPPQNYLKVSYGLGSPYSKSIIKLKQNISLLIHSEMY